MVNRKISTQMKSVGEVMAIGRNFEEAIQKAVRMLEIGYDGLTPESNGHMQIEELEEKLLNPDDEIMFTVIEALQKGLSIERISKVSSIDPWFIAKLDNIVNMEKNLIKSELDADLIYEAKRLGFSDKQIGRCVGMDALRVREFRKQANILPVVKQIDTLAAEWPAKTNYLYLTYGGSTDDLVLEKYNSSRVIVLGAGPYRIAYGLRLSASAAWFAPVGVAWPALPAACRWERRAGANNPNNRRRTRPLCRRLRERWCW